MDEQCSVMRQDGFKTYIIEQKVNLNEQKM